jgi:predicted nucleotidyltransferase
MRVATSDEDHDTRGQTRKRSGGGEEGRTARDRALEARIHRLMEALRGYEPECVYLVGSAARGEADELSDLDVIVIKRKDASFLDRLRDVALLLPYGMGAVDVLVYTPDEFAAMRRDGNAFAETIVEEGRLLYGTGADR